MTNISNGGRWALLAAVVALGCSSSSSSAVTTDGCMTDGDCRSGRRCTLGQCVDAAGTGGKGGAAGAGGAPTAGGAAGTGGVRNEPVASDAPCTVFPQAGCPTGHVCLVANSSGATSCYVAGSLPLGGLCTGINDCAPGLLCQYGQCRSICQSSADCPQKPYGSCDMYPAAKGAAPFPGFGFCSLQCNPADSANAAGDAAFSPCNGDARCLASSDGAPGTTECFANGTSGPGAACSAQVPCVANNVCLTDQSGKSTCTPYCLMGKGSCTKGTCSSFATKDYVGVKGTLVEIGYCQ